MLTPSRLSYPGLLFSFFVLVTQVQDCRANKFILESVELALKKSHIISLTARPPEGKTVRERKNKLETGGRDDLIFTVLVVFIFYKMGVSEAYQDNFTID